MQKSQVKLCDWQVIESIAPYFTLQQLFKVSTLSKQFSFNLKNYIRKYVLPQNISQYGNLNEFQIMKKIFHRNLIIYQISKSKIKSIIPNMIIDTIQAGNSFTLIEPYEGSSLIIDTKTLLQNQLKTFKEIKNFYQGQKIRLFGQYLFIIKQKKIKMVTLKPNQQQIWGEQQQIQYQADIQQIKCFQSFMLVITKNTFEQNKLYSVNYKYFEKPIQVIYEINSEVKTINSSKLSSAPHGAYYIINNTVYQLDIQKSNLPKIVKSLKDKNIRCIYNGQRHFFAVQKKTKKTQQWNTIDVIQWAKNEGFQDYIKIFKSQKVNGKTMLQMNRKYMEDVLGIMNVKIQQRIQLRLQQCNQQNLQDDVIYGWGRNDKCQLGLNPSNPIDNPVKIKLPNGFNILKCEGQSTILYNKKIGQVLINSVTEDNKAEWKTVAKNIYKIWSISISKEEIMILSPVEKDKIAQNLCEEPVHHKKQKLRTAKNIIDKIQWSQNLDKKDFRVGYLDKYTGMLEITFDQLLQAQQIKDYRIQYFKKRGEVVWSKKDRIDIL